MKRFVLLSLIALFGITIVSCNKTNNQLEAKTGLTISGTDPKIALALGCSTFQWVQQVEGNSVYQSLAPDINGDVYALHSIINRKYNGFLIAGHILAGSILEKIDGANNVLWFYQPLQTIIAQIKSDGQGNVYALTLPHDDGHINGHIIQLLQKISPAGHMIWQTQVGDNGYSVSTGAVHTVTRFAIDNAGNAVLVGSYAGNGQNPVVFGNDLSVYGSGMFATYLAPDGAQVAVNTGIATSGLPVDTVSIMGNGNAMCLGNHSNGGANQLDMQVFDKNGNRLIARSFNTGDPFIRPHDCSLAASGSIYFVYTGHHIFKFNTAGNLIFKIADPQQLDTTAYKLVQQLAADSKGNLYLAHTTITGQAIDMFNSNGNLLGTAAFPFASIRITSLLIDQRDQFYFGASYVGSIALSPNVFISKSINDYQLGYDSYPSILVKYNLCH